MALRIQHKLGVPVEARPGHVKGGGRLVDDLDRVGGPAGQPRDGRQIVREQDDWRLHPHKVGAPQGVLLLGMLGRPRVVGGHDRQRVYGRPVFLAPQAAVGGVGGVARPRRPCREADHLNPGRLPQPLQRGRAGLCGRVHGHIGGLSEIQFTPRALVDRIQEALLRRLAVLVRHGAGLQQVHQPGELGLVGPQHGHARAERVREAAALEMAARPQATGPVAGAAIAWRERGGQRVDKGGVRVHVDHLAAPRQVEDMQLGKAVGAAWGRAGGRDGRHRFQAPPRPPRPVQGGPPVCPALQQQQDVLIKVAIAMVQGRLGEDFHALDVPVLGGVEEERRQAPAFGLAVRGRTATHVGRAGLAAMAGRLRCVSGTQP